MQLPEVDGQVLRQLMDSLQGLTQHAKTVAGGIQQVGYDAAQSPVQMCALDHEQFKHL